LEVSLEHCGLYGLQVHGPLFIFTTTNTANSAVFHFLDVEKDLSHGVKLVILYFSSYVG